MGRSKWNDVNLLMISSSCIICFGLTKFIGQLAPVSLHFFCFAFHRGMQIPIHCYGGYQSLGLR